MFPFYTPRNETFSDVLREYKKGTLERNGLKGTFEHIIMFYRILIISNLRTRTEQDLSLSRARTVAHLEHVELKL